MSDIKSSCSSAVEGGNYRLVTDKVSAQPVRSRAERVGHADSAREIKQLVSVGGQNNVCTTIVE